MIHNAAKMKPTAVEVHNNYTIAIDYDGSGNMIYVGKAYLGSSKADGVWSIRKFVYNGSNLTDIQWANGDGAFNNIWNNRVSISYS